jgi:hypothetical protein
MNDIKVIGIHIFDRIKEAGHTQRLLTKYGHIIKTRYGFHEVSEDVCSREGIILLELRGDKNTWDSFIVELNEIGGINVNEMNFNLD